MPVDGMPCDGRIALRQPIAPGVTRAGANDERSGGGRLVRRDPLSRVIQCIDGQWQIPLVEMLGDPASVGESHEAIENVLASVCSDFGVRE